MRIVYTCSDKTDKDDPVLSAVSCCAEHWLDAGREEQEEREGEEEGQEKEGAKAASWCPRNVESSKDRMYNTCSKVLI